MLNRTTINARIKRGMTREEAENTPLLIDKKLTLQKVLEVEAHGLSLSDSAYLLRVTPQVAPFTGAWIETLLKNGMQPSGACRALHGRVD